MSQKEIIDAYRITVGENSAKARALIKKLKYKNDYYLLQCIAQTYLDESRFKDNGDMRKYPTWRKWKLAEKYIIEAFKLNRKNGEVLYTMGKVRMAVYQNEIAIYCFKEIIRLGEERISEGEYSRGEMFARELINDSRFELYRLYYDTNRTLSKRYLSMFKKKIDEGVPTIFWPLKDFLLEEEPKTLKRLLSYPKKG